jgi:2,4-dienoyl-CoA reductase-like NADH-dependent reductase (Old Yellow Enzyme family)
MALLFEPIKIRSVEVKNRIVVSPMCQYSSEDGFANDWHLVHLGSRAIGGAGIVFTEATAVSPEARITLSDLGIWKDEHIDFLQRITHFIDRHGSVAAIQLAHAGRKASHHVTWKGSAPLNEEEGAWKPLAPSAVPYHDNETLPNEMSKADIKKVINDFRHAAIRSIKAGFKIIEIHAAHGYLLNEFLSPLSNFRTDEYGGSFENRIRILLEIVETIRSILKEEFPLFVRISATDWIDGGWTDEDSVALAVILKNKGVDVIDCSSGGNISSQKITVSPLYQVPFAEKIKKETGILTGAVGLITTAQQAEDILIKKQADLIFIARQFLRDPYFSLHAAKELDEDICWPEQYHRAK